MNFFKKVTIILLSTFALIGTTIFLVNPVVIHAQELETEMTEYDNTDSLKVISTIEEEMQEQGTSIIEVLIDQLDNYTEEFKNTSDHEKETVFSIIETLNEAIAAFEGTAYILPKDSNFKFKSRIIF